VAVFTTQGQASHRSSSRPARTARRTSSLCVGNIRIPSNQDLLHRRSKRLAHQLPDAHSRDDLKKPTPQPSHRSRPHHHRAVRHTIVPAQIPQTKSPRHYAVASIRPTSHNTADPSKLQTSTPNRPTSPKPTSYQHRATQPLPTVRAPHYNTPNPAPTTFRTSRRIYLL